MVEAGITGAEIIERDRHPHALERGKHGLGRLEIGDQRIFSYLDFQTFGRDTALRQDRQDARRQQRIDQLAGREVERQLEVARPGFCVEANLA